MKSSIISTINDSLFHQILILWTVIRIFASTLHLRCTWSNLFILPEHWQCRLIDYTVTLPILKLDRWFQIKTHWRVPRCWDLHRYTAIILFVMLIKMGSEILYGSEDLTERLDEFSTSSIVFRLLSSQVHTHQGIDDNSWRITTIPIACTHQHTNKLKVTHSATLIAYNKKTLNAE